MDYKKQLRKQVSTALLLITGFLVICVALLFLHQIIGRDVAGPEADQSGTLETTRQAQERRLAASARPELAAEEAGLSSADSTSMELPNPFDLENASGTTNEIPEFFTGAVPDPNTVGALATLLSNASDLFEAARFEEAMEQIKQAKTLYPHSSAGIELLLGSCYARMNELPKAQTHLRNAIQLAPTYVSAYEQLGLVYFDQEQLLDSEQAFLCALAIAPDNPMAEANLGRIYFRLRRFSEAISYLEAYVARKPRGYVPHELLLASYIASKDLDQAGQILQEARDQFPDHWQFIAHQAVLEALEGDFEKALSSIELCLRKTTIQQVHSHLRRTYRGPAETEQPFLRLMSALDKMRQQATN